MDVLLWILIGLAAGLGLGATSSRSGTEQLSEMAGRRIGGMIAGVIGSLAGGYGLLLLRPALRGDGLTTSLAAFAGALWVSWTTHVFATRRRHGEGVGAVDDGSNARASRNMDMPAYDAARQALVDGLTEDASAHDAGRYAEVGWRFASIRDAVARQDASAVSRLHVALSFWRGWMQARDGRWPVPGAGIAAADWPRLARRIASDLALDRDVSDPMVRTHFAYDTPSLTVTPTPTPASGRIAL
jgi:hypothetical protein